MQLNRFVAASGVCSRRNAVTLIKAGKIMVNNARCQEPGYRVQETDRVSFQRRLLHPVKPVYVLVNKPSGYLTTRVDPEGRPTVFDLCSAFDKEGVRLFPVGRLDGDSEGLLLLTTDGALTEALAHPRLGVTKAYRVKIHRPLEEGFAQQLCAGVFLEDGVATCDRVLVHPRNPACVTVILHSGKNRVIRRLFAAGGYHVNELRRIQYGPIKGNGLPLGGWRYLNNTEVALLRRTLQTASQ